MIDRIKQVIEYSQLSSSAFADTIGISRSGLTHLLTGRNQPSLDVARKILAKFPEISTEWLIMGMGEMFRTEGNVSVEKEPVEDPAKAYPAENGKFMRQTDLFSEYENMDDSAQDIPIQTSDESSENIDNADDTKESSLVAEIKPENITRTPIGRQPEGRVRTRKTPDIKPLSASVKRDKFQPVTPGKKLQKIVFFYDDHSFEVFIN